MSISDSPLRFLPREDQKRVRRELLTALAKGQWVNVQEVTETVRQSLREDERDEFRAGPGTLFTALSGLTDEGLVQIKEENVGPNGHETRTMCRLTAYGKDELDQMGAANV
ncbi:MAG: PadR family transcriptional regulator [Rubrobacter sp.]|nr:PadR family transcriptional regulator [Rubrobacter sp.]